MPLIFCVELVRLEVATCIRCSLAVLGRWSYRWLALGIFLECLYHILGAVAYGLAVAGNLRDGHQGCRYGAYQQHRKGWARDVHYLHLADAMCSFTEDLCANLALVSKVIGQCRGRQEYEAQTQPRTRYPNTRNIIDGNTSIRRWDGYRCTDLQSPRAFSTKYTGPTSILRPLVNHPRWYIRYFTLPMASILGLVMTVNSMNDPESNRRELKRKAIDD